MRITFRFLSWCTQPDTSLPRLSFRNHGHNHRGQSAAGDRPKLSYSLSDMCMAFSFHFAFGICFPMYSVVSRMTPCFYYPTAFLSAILSNATFSSSTLPTRIPSNRPFFPLIPFNHFMPVPPAVSHRFKFGV